MGANTHTVVALVALAFTGSLGMTLVILACALPAYRLWWPFFVVVFYVLSLFPTMIAKRRLSESGSGTNPCFELSIFLTMGIVISSFALPIVLARATAIQWGACYLTLAGNFVVYLTLLGYFVFLDNDESTYGGMW